MRKLETICPNCFGTLDKSGFCFGCRRYALAEDDNQLTLPLKTLLKNHYLVGRPLGKGGFGITYLGWDMYTCERVAIKEFFPKGYTTRLNDNSVAVIKEEHTRAFNHWLAAFSAEARILTSIKHLPGVVRLRDFFEANGTAYIVMDYLDGMSLRKYLDDRGGKIPLNETLNIIRPVLESLVVIHQYGVIHKDISPENIQIVQNRYVKLIDFGAASVYNMTTSKPFVILKRGYSPIETYAKDYSQGPWTDVYEIAATIYNCLTGLIPVEATERLKRDTLPRPSAYGVKIPPVQENSLMKALAVLPQNRYNNAAEFIQMLYGEFFPRNIVPNKH